MKKSPYSQLLEMSKHASVYSSISMLLEWDHETYMPSKAIELRSKQLEMMASLIHKEKTSKEYAHVLDQLIDLGAGAFKDPNLTPGEQANVRELRRDYIKSAKLPSSFVKEFASTTSASMHAWRKAKEDNNFKNFQPHLEKIVELCRKKAEIYGYKDHPYDALIDEFEPEMTTKVVATLLGKIKIPLKTLLTKIASKQTPREDFLHKIYPHHKQLLFAKKILTTMGFDKNFSRLDETEHPMMIGLHPLDIRMTTRVNPNRFFFSLSSTAHEGGHGLYHAHLPVEHFGTPLGEAASLAIDESQSRMWETIIGQSHSFWEYFYPLLQKEFPENLSDIKLEEFYKAINHVNPSLIRTESDEVTYNLHIMVRFELELALIEGSLAVKDLPEAWNEKMRELLGVVPKADSEGCIQDIHWSMGAIGYFPTYTLGNLCSGQFFETFAKQHPNWQQKVAKGELQFITDWFKDKIYRHGRFYLPEDLVEHVTGHPLSEKPFISYLESKYKTLYNLG